MLGSEMPLPAVYKQDGCQVEERDPCASPPCKRFRQASLPFQVIIDDDTTTNKKQNENNAVAIQDQEEPTTIPTTNDKTFHQNAPADSSETTPMETEPLKNAPILIPSETSSIQNNEQTVEITSPIKLPDTNANNNNVQNSPHNSSATSTIKDGILKYAQPVTPGCQSNRNQSTITTPPKSTVIELSTPNNPDVSAAVSTTPKQDEPCSLVSTPGNKPMTTTPKGKTPGRKLSVEEKLKREEEKMKKQKEREQQEKERVEKKKEKERLKMEKEKERKEDKLKKEEEKLEQLALKKQREKERQEKKEQEEKEKRERLERKEEERKKRDEEKKKKEDEKSLRNEEKRKREEEQNLKKQKAQNSFASFFIKKETSSSPKQKEQVEVETKFQPFELKPFMKLANMKPIQPLSESAKEILNKSLSEQTATSISSVKEEFQRIKEKVSVERQVVDLAVTNEAEQNFEDEVMIVDDDTNTTSKKVIEGVTPKLLQFHDNYRPAYFGTWRKKSSCVGPRGPFKKDEGLINYEVDSDEEWEEEEPGESLSNSEGEEDEKDDEKEDEKEDGENDGFFVPHGYLSDDEGVEDGKDEETGQTDCTNEESTPGHHKSDDRMERQLAKQKAWETEMKRQFKPMRPVAIGCIWNGEMPSLLKQLEACCLVSGSIDPVVKNQVSDPRPNSPCSTTAATTPTTYCNTAMPVPEEAMPSLIKLVHGNTDGLHKIMKQFRKQWTLQNKRVDEEMSDSNWEEHCAISKRQLERRITNIARKEKRPDLPKARWYVHGSVLAKYQMEDTPTSCQDANFNNNIMEATSPLSNKVGHPTTPNIKQFTENVDIPGGQNATDITEIVKETHMDTSPVRLG